MWLIVQIAVGVCFGLLLFRFVALHPPHRPHWTIGGAIRFCALALVGLWIFDLALKAFR